MTQSELRSGAFREPALRVGVSTAPDGRDRAFSGDRAFADRVRQVLATPDPADGLPVFLPYVDENGHEVWAERSRLTPAQWQRVHRWLLERLTAELG